MQLVLVALALSFSGVGRAEGVESHLRRSVSATALYAEADAAMQAGNFVKAEALLERLWGLSPTFDVAASLADVELRLNDPLSAAKHAKFALVQFPVTESAKFRESIQRVFDGAVKQLGLLRIFTEPAGPQLLLDGEPTEARPLVLPGTHRVTARLTGYAEATQVITVQALEQIDVRLELAPLQVEAQLAVTVSPADSVVTVNGQPVTEQREGRVEVSLVPGVHQVTVSHPGYLTQSRELDARAGVEYPLTIHLKPDSDVTPGLWILGVGGSAALASGVIGGVTLAGAAPGSQENRAGTSWMLGSMGLSLVTSVTWQVWSSADAPAGSARGYLNRTFIAGNTPGEPSMNKLVVVSALHGATLAAVGVGVWKYLAMRETARESDRAGAIGLCADADASPCAAWNADRQVIDRDRKLSISLIGSAAVLHLIGMAVAEGWSNVTASTDGQAGTASLHGTF